MVFSPLLSLIPLLLLSYGANAHGVLTAISGTNGVTAQGFGVIASTPRTGSTPVPFEQDTSVIRENEIQNGKTGVCGRTRAGGDNDVSSQLNAAVLAGLPSAAADGTVTMTLHQVNGDGAGPYTCSVSTDATGANFIAMTVTTNVPGKNSRSNAKATDFPLVAQLPPGTSCTGGANGNACLVRCTNSAQAGPFGGCAAITTNNSTADSTTSAVAITSSASVTSTSVDTSTSVLSTSATVSSATSTTVATVDGGDVTGNDSVVAESAAPSVISTASTTLKAKGFGARAGTSKRGEKEFEARMERRIRRSRIFAMNLH